MGFLKKIPIVATAFNLADFISMLDTKGRTKRFEDEFSQYFGSKYVFTVNSGTSAFYIILKALSRSYPERKEVILPAYTAASLVLPVQKLKLKVVLCDISLETFNLDIRRAAQLVSENTLCLVGVHLFGLALDIDGLRLAIKEKNKDTIIVEDCAQAMGTKIDTGYIGARGDISLYSFNRGKNLSTSWGGAVSTNNDRLGSLLKEELLGLKEAPIWRKFKLFFEFVILSLAVRPLFYNILYNLLRIFRSVKPPLNFLVFKYTNIQAAVGSSLLKRLEIFSLKRYYCGFVLHKALSTKKDVILPALLGSSRPAFNRFPVVFRDAALKEKIRKEFLKKGIDSSGMYESPLHMVFDLGYNMGSLPNAEYFAKGLLTLPSHPLVSEKMLQAMKKILEVNL